MKNQFLDNITITSISAILFSVLSNIIMILSFDTLTIIALICLVFSVVFLVYYVKKKNIKENEANKIIQREKNLTRKRKKEIYQDKFQQVKVAARISISLVILFLLTSIVLITINNQRSRTISKVKINEQVVKPNNPPKQNNSE